MTRKLPVAILAPGLRRVRASDARSASFAALRLGPPDPQRQECGDGGYAPRLLRPKTASDPENIAVRLELAKACQDRGYPEVGLRSTGSLSR